MSLTSEQELEMYADIKVIKNNCLSCRKTQDNHERRISFLEKGYWIFVGVSSMVTFILPFFINSFMKGGN